MPVALRVTTVPTRPLRGERVSIRRDTACRGVSRGLGVWAATKDLPYQQDTQLWLLMAPRLSSNAIVSGNGWIRW
jgi:hypothetical protein